MIRLCWVFVLVVVVPLFDARPHKCEQRERSLADLELAEDALNRAKLLYPNSEEETESSNSSKCSKKDQSLGFIDVALDLVSNAKRNIPICPHVLTEDNLTTAEEPLTMTEEILTMTEESTPEVTTENFRPIDCQELQAAGRTTSGVYSVWPQGGKSAVRVRCDMDTDGGGWTVFQRRGNFSLQENFDRDWQDYKNGFGNLERDFWLGNDNIFALSNQGHYSLRIDMTAADGDSAFALYREFRIEDENANYTLHVGGYKGNAGDDMTYSDEYMFSTKDRINNNHRLSRNCGEIMMGGFWYDNCAECNPNGLHNPGVAEVTSMHYYRFKNIFGLLSMEMKMKRTR